MSARETLEGVGFAERTRYNATYSVLASKHLTCDLAIAVKLGEGNYISVSRDLENRVRGGVNDKLACFKMLLAEILDDLCSRIRLVAKNTATRELFKPFNNVRGESVGIGGKRALGNYSRDLPVSRGGVLAA